MTKRYLGNIITQNPTAPAGDLANSAAKGVWSLEEQLAYQKSGLWPIPGNFPPSVGDVFSTYLYEGTGQELTITNGIDLDGEGGLVWIKDRTGTGYNALFDTERGFATDLGYDSYYKLESNGTNAQTRLGYGFQSMNSDGFTIGYDNGAGTNACDGNLGTNGTDYASWTFRKAPKFFDVVTYSGTGSAQNINHSLGQSPGMIIIKSTSNTENWQVWHRSVTGNLELDNTGALNAGSVRLENVTDTSFGVKTFNTSNGSGQTYVAYLFAHNDGDGGFGPDGSDIIKCGSYVGTGVEGSPEVDLGFEPQWILIKNVTTAQDWIIVDEMRGLPVGSDSKVSRPNLDSADFNSRVAELTATGFKVGQSAPRNNSNGETYIYMAIRRGPMAVPESGTEVFALDQSDGTEPSFDSGFPVDFAIRRTYSTAYTLSQSRLTGARRIATNVSDAELSDTSNTWDHMEGWSAESNTSYYSWMWKRAPGFFDGVAYTGTGGGSGQTINYSIKHNLGVTPELLIIKARTAAQPWPVFTGLGVGDNYLLLNTTNGNLAGGASPEVTLSETDFTIKMSWPAYSSSGNDYIAYLFASLDGISKVGSYTGNGSSQTIDCGFTSGAKFILIKRTDDAGNWYFWDTEQGIIAGNSPHMTFNTTDAQVTTDDSIDPASSGFIVNQVSATDVNVSSATYIFYAIA